MSKSVTLPEVNIPEEELKLLLAIKLLDEGLAHLPQFEIQSLYKSMC